MPERGVLKKVYVYDGSFEGILCAVHRAYYSKEEPEEIVKSDALQRDLFSEYVYIQIDRKKSDAVYSSISTKISSNALFLLYNVFLSEEPDKATVIYQYLRRGYALGAKVALHFQDPWVLRAQKISQYVSLEAQRLSGFLRFSQMEGNILYSAISPVNNILELLCQYFADRLPSQPWVIADTKRRMAGVYNGERWVISEVDAASLPGETADELEYQKLWRAFYNTIGIAGRKNHNLRRQLMPKMYWKNMTEFKYDDRI